MHLKNRPLFPSIAMALISIGIATAIALIGYFALRSWLGIEVSFFWVFSVAGGFAALLGLLLRLPVWWIPLNLVFPIAIYLCLSAGIPSWVYLLSFVVLALIYWNAAGERVPLYLTNSTTWQAINKLSANQDGAFIDLGCGLGGILFYLSEIHPDRRYTGIESAPLPYAFAKARQILSGRRNIEIRYGDFWKEDLGRYQTIYAFLSPAPMPRLYEKISTEMPKGGLFISNSFTVPEVEPDSVVRLDDARQTQLLAWYL